MLQNATLLRKSAPGPPNISDKHVSCIAPATENASLQILSFLEMLQNPHVLLTFDKVQNPLRLPHKTTTERPKVLWSHQFLTLLTSKCASCHNGMHLFDIATSKSGPNLVCFVHFDLEMCFAPQRRATFHLSSILIWPHGSAPAALASLLFDPPDPQIIGKTKWIATFLPFAHLHLLSSDSFSSLIFLLLLFSSLTLPTSDFHLSILSEVWLLNFLRLYVIPICCCWWWCWGWWFWRWRSLWQCRWRCRLANRAICWLLKIAPLCSHPPTQTCPA